MTAFLITMLVVYGISFVVDCKRLVQYNYPHMTRHGSGTDIRSIIITIGMASWVIYLLSAT